jgi:ubiquinone/menaquinone biosynthesis C-methylase UbiE
MKRGQLLHPGDSTALGGTVEYRLGKVERVRRIEGRWLDCGCAEGDFTHGLIEHGASQAVGSDVLESRIQAARERWPWTAALSFVVAAAEKMPFPDETFDGVLINEVLEHVTDEVQALRELHRILVPGGFLFVFSPNRWFPFEGHGAAIGRVKLRFPVPLLPWLPMRLTIRALQARNWWPRQLRDLVASVGFDIIDVDFALPLFGRYRWMPAPLMRTYEKRFASFERLRWLRRFGVSTVVAARKG